MKLLDRTMLPDSGEVVWEKGVTVTRLEQEVPDDVEGTTFDVVAAGLGPAGLLLSRYHDASHRVAHPSTLQQSQLDRSRRRQCFHSAIPKVVSPLPGAVPVCARWMIRAKSSHGLPGRSYVRGLRCLARGYADRAAGRLSRAPG